MLKLGLSGAMFAGLFMTILGFYQYSSSGMEVTRVELQPGVVNRGEIELTPDMNTLRALVATGFTNSSTSMHVTHYDYRFELADRAGVVVMKEENSTSSLVKKHPVSISGALLREPPIFSTVGRLIERIPITGLQWSRIVRLVLNRQRLLSSKM